MTNIIYENKYYFIQMGESTHSERKFSVYQVINKEYGVVETESTVLPLAINHADDFANELSNYYKEQGRIVSLN